MRHLLALAFAALPLATSAATVIREVDGPGTGAPVVFSGWSGGYDMAAVHGWGRFNPNGGTYHDSYELPVLTWAFESAAPVTSLVFGVIDFYDQPGSFFDLIVNGEAVWDAGADEYENASLVWLEVSGDEPFTTALFEARTSTHEPWGDGFGIIPGTFEAPAPVPLPASLSLLGTALGGFGALAWLKRKAARRSAPKALPYRGFEDLHREMRAMPGALLLDGSPGLARDGR